MTPFATLGAAVAAAAALDRSFTGPVPQAADLGWPTETVRSGRLTFSTALPMQHLQHFPQSETDRAGEEYLVETFTPAAEQRTIWRVWQRKAGTWSETGGTLGAPAKVDAQLYTGTVAANASPDAQSGAIRGAAFVAVDGRWWRWQGDPLAWALGGDLVASGSPTIHTGSGAPVDGDLTSPSNGDLYIEGFRLAGAEETVAVAPKTIDFWDVLGRLPCTRHVLQDAARARAFVDGRLAASAMYRVDRLIGLELSVMDGVGEVTGATATDVAKIEEGVQKALDMVEDAGRSRATVIFVGKAPWNLWSMAAAKKQTAMTWDAGGTARYRGIPVQRSDALSGEAWGAAVSAPVHTEVLFHPRARVEFSRSHGTDFANLRLTARCWVRALLAVYRPQAVARVTSAS